MKYLYLIIDLSAVSIPLMFSFHPQIRFYEKFRSALPAILIPAFIFTIWDIIFAERGVWGFNSRYITGYHLLNLPVEEILFFICIPYACLFTYYCLTHFFSYDCGKKSEDLFLFFFIPSLILMGLEFADRAYTFYSMIFCATILLILKFIIKPDWFGRFLLAYLVLLVPFLIVNGLLTGYSLKEPIVWYNNMENSGIRIMTIPLEDFIYSMELMLFNVFIFESLSKRFSYFK